MSIFSKRGQHHDDPRVRLKAVEKLDSQEDLVEVACTDDSPRVRLAALARVEGDAPLAQIAKDAQEIDVRLAAVDRIGSQQMLADIIKARKNFQLMGACFSRITDRKILEAIAEDTGYNPTARRLAVEQFADESYLQDFEPTPEKSAVESKADIDGLMKLYGGVRMVRAIGKFRRSEKALHALGKIAQQGGDAGELAIEYLCRALASDNPALQQRAADGLAALADPHLVACLVRSLDDPKLRKPIQSVLERIDTPEARDVLGLE